MRRERGWKRVWGNLKDEDGEGLKRRGSEEGGGEGLLGGGEEMGKALEDRHLVDQFVEMGDVRWGA